jgi:tetratricopeptide (TPR) repeat protein
MTDDLERFRAALADRYDIERELGRGGMAIVYLAHDRKHDRQVAIKAIGREYAEHLGSERFLREIKTAAKLNHPNILPLYDSGEAAGQLYYVMPYVEGGSLRDRLQREGPLPLEDALDVAREVAQALTHAHEHGFVHRDIKPENILFLSGRPVVADFGIARAAESADRQLTQTGMAVGTPAYMSPEQALADRVDGRSDIYSLGCVLYEMVTGNPPYSGGSAREIIARHTTDAVPSLRAIRPAVPENVDATVAKALAKEPADRFRTAQELAEALTGRIAVIRARSQGGVVPRLLRPRVLGIMTAYVVAAILAWLGVSVVADRLALSPHLPRFVLAFLAFLLPAVAVVAYTMGNGGTRWRAAQTAGVSANVVAAALALVLLFGGKDLGAATVAVTLTDEDGNVVERVIPKAEFRKRITVFYFDADESDARAHWLGYGIPAALTIDLHQNLFIDQRGPGQYRDPLREAGFRALTGVPLALKRQLAAEQFRDQFVSGQVTTEGDEIIVTMSLYETGNGDLISDTTVRGTDPLELVDELSKVVAGSAQVPEGYRERIRDLPAAELLTSSQAAFERYGRMQEAIVVRDDWETAAQLLEEAVAEDETFAAAQLQLFVVYLLLNRGEESRAPLQAAVDHAYRLPERLQNQVRAEWYTLRQEADKAYALLKMNAELYPEDVTALTAVAQTQAYRNLRREAIETYERILELDPQQQDFLREIGDLHQSLGEYDEALDAYGRYARLNPDDERSFTQIADLHVTLGRHDEARTAFERALLIDPGDVTTAVKLARLELVTGSFDASLPQYENALGTARTASDSATALGGLASYYLFRGRAREALQYREREVAAEVTSLPPLQVAVNRLQDLDDYVYAGDTARALAIFDSISGALQPPFDGLSALGRLRLSVALEDPGRIDSAVVATERLIEQFSWAFLQPLVAYARGRAHYLRGDYQGAVASWEEQRRLNPSDWSIARQLGEAYRGLGNLEQAEALILEAQRISPAAPRTHYELALVYADMGRNSDAVVSLRRALDIWSDADSSYIWALRALAKLAELHGGS